MKAESAIATSEFAPGTAIQIAAEELERRNGPEVRDTFLDMMKTLELPAHAHVKITPEVIELFKHSAQQSVRLKAQKQADQEAAKRLKEEREKKRKIAKQEVLEKSEKIKALQEEQRQHKERHTTYAEKRHTTYAEIRRARTEGLFLQEARRIRAQLSASPVRPSLPDRLLSTKNTTPVPA